MSDKSRYVERSSVLAVMCAGCPSVGLCPADCVVKKNVDLIPSADVVSGRDFRDCRNELCLQCGQYKTAHLGSCSDCRWKDV